MAVHGGLDAALASGRAEPLGLVLGAVDVDLIAARRVADPQPPGILAPDGQGDAGRTATGPALAQAVVRAVEVHAPGPCESVQPWPGVGPVQQSVRQPGCLVDVAGINLLWCAGCFGLLASGEIAPNGLGVAFIIAQAVAVAVLGVLQFLGLRDAASIA